MYNSEALPFTYGQYVVIELADKLYNSVTVFFSCFAKVCLSLFDGITRSVTTSLLKHHN